MKLTIKKLFALLVLTGLGITASFAQSYSKGDNLSMASLIKLVVALMLLMQVKQHLLDLAILNTLTY
jgi:beta-lactamase class A